MGYQEGMAGRAASAGDWAGICGDLLEGLSSDGMDTGLCASAFEQLSRSGSSDGMRDLAHALALAADVDTGPRTAASRERDAALGPAYAACASWYLSRTQGAYLGYLGGHGWVPGEGIGGAVMADMNGDALRRLSGMGLSWCLPASVPDGFGPGGTYGRVPSGAVLRRAAAASGMSMAERMEACGSLLYGLWAEGRGRLPRGAAGFYFRAAIGGLSGGSVPDVSPLLLRICVVGLAAAAGRGADVEGNLDEVRTLADGLGAGHGAWAFLEACGAGK